MPYTSSHGAEAPVGGDGLHLPEIPARLRRLENLANWMDAGYRVPGLGIRFGWDGILGLVPVVGDLLSAFPALWILTEAHRMGARTGTLVRMGANVGIDVVVGAVPLLGDMFDVAFKANRRNVDLLRRDMAKGPRPSRTVWPGRAPVAKVD